MAAMWTARLQGVPEGDHHKALSINGKIYMFDPDLDHKYRFSHKPVEVHVFDPDWHQWELLQAHCLPDGSPWRRYGRTAVAYGDSAYLWTCRDYEEYGRVYRFNAKTRTWSRLDVSGPWPEIRFGQTACLVGHRVYLFGGWPVFDPPLSLIEVLDLKTLQWRRVSTRGQLPAMRKYHTASAIGNRMYIWGGDVLEDRYRDAYDNSLLFLDTATSTWVRPRVDGKLPDGREDHSAFAYHGEMYVFGGLDFNARKYFGSIHKYNPAKSCWTEVTPDGLGPSPRRLAGCCVIGHRVFVFGGGGLKSKAEDWRQADGNDEQEEELTDLHILQFTPTLKTMCLVAVIDAGVNADHLPPAIRKEVRAITGDKST